MLTTIGRKPCFRSGSASRVVSARAKKLVSMTRRRAWGSESAKAPIAPTPALFTRMSSPPNFDWAALMACCRVAGSVMSPTTVSTGVPRAAICSAS